MYKIIGADQKEYGPVDAEQILKWIREGRANAQTMVMVEGRTGRAPLGTIAEFAEALSTIPSPARRTAHAPPLAGAGAPKTNGMALAGLVLSIFGLACCGPLFSTLGLIFALVGLSQINKNPKREKGKNMAIAGIVIAVLGYILFIVLLVTGVVHDVISQLK